MTEAMILDSEAAVIANFEFLTQADTEMSDDDDMSDEIGENEETDMKTTKRKAKATMNDGRNQSCLNPSSTTWRRTKI